MRRLCCGLALCLVASAAAAHAQDERARMLAAAHAQVGVTVLYDPAYRRMAYPGGDVPLERGVCSDVIVRAWRAAGIDLQAELHRDMRSAFAAYPRTWRIAQPDAYIDHHRVPSLETWLQLRGSAIAVSQDPRDYHAGDLVTWRLERGQPHIGIVSDHRSPDGQRPLIVHNIGAGVQVEDVLFGWRIHAHFRYFRDPPAVAR